MRECVLGKLRPPEGTLKRKWITAGGGFYGQWIWDTMFVVDLLSLLPGMEQNIREVFQNYWDFQVRWNEQMPAYAHDMVACMLEPKNNNWLKYPAYSQIPILRRRVVWRYLRGSMRRHHERSNENAGHNSVARSCQIPARSAIADRAGLRSHGLTPS